MTNTKYFLLTPVLEIKEYNTVDNIIKHHPYAIIKEVLAQTHKTKYGNLYPIYHYLFLNSKGKERALNIKGWCVFNSTVSYHRGLTFENKWSGFYYNERVLGQTLVGIANTYKILDPSGEVKEVVISNKEDLMTNLNIYRKFRSWTEVEQFKINSQLQITIQQLQEENSQLKDQLKKLQ